MKNKKLKFYIVYEGDIGGSSWIREVNTSIKNARNAAKFYQNNNSVCDEIFIVKNILKFENWADFNDAKNLLKSIKDECFPKEKVVNEIFDLAEDYDPMFDSETVDSYLVIKQPRRG